METDNLFFLKTIILLLTILSLLGICVLFLLSFFEPSSGPLYFICAAGVLLLIGFFFIFVHFYERKSDRHRIRFSGIKRFLGISIRVIILCISIATLIASFVLFLVFANYYFLVNSGCLTAYIMIIFLIEIFLRILMPLAGFSQYS